MSSIDAKELTDLGGFKICGLRGGKSFMEMQRPIDMKGNCPEGFQVCNPDAEADNRVCTKNLDECPINDIKLVTNKDGDINWNYISVTPSS